MPKLKRRPEERQLAEIVAEIKYGQALYDVSNELLMAAAQMSSRTFYRRLRSPETFTIGELTRIGAAIHTELKFERRATVY